MPVWVTITVALISSSGAVMAAGVSLVLFLIQRKDSQKEKQQNQERTSDKLMLGIAHDRIMFLGTCYIKRGWITFTELDNLKCIYEPYHELGGNGSAKIMMEEVNKLDTRPGGMIY